MRDDAVLGHALPLDRGLGPCIEIRTALELTHWNCTHTILNIILVNTILWLPAFGIASQIPLFQQSLSKVFKNRLRLSNYGQLKRHVSTTTLNCLAAEFQETCSFILLVNLHTGIRLGHRCHWPMSTGTRLCLIKWLLAFFGELFIHEICIFRHDFWTSC